MKSKIFATAAAIAMIAVCLAAIPAESDAAITVEDGLGKNFSFSSPVNKVIAVGVGPTATVIGIGCLDKIVVSDNYSYKNTDPLFADFKKLVDQGKIAAGGNIYSSGKAQLKTDIVAAADPETGTFDMKKDLVIVTGSDTYRANIVPDLEELGFRYVMQWRDITSYSDIIDFAEAISEVCTGREVAAVEEMENVVDYIEDKAEDARVQKKEAFYVTYSANTFKVGNTGSLATSMILAAFGKVITLDSDKPSTYEANITNIVAEHPGCIIFVDNTIHSDAGKYDDLKRAAGGKATFVDLKPIWNNYCIESMYGVWTMACAMYPDLFEGDVPVHDGGSDDNLVLYLAAGLVAVAVIGIAAYFFMRP